MYDPTIHPQNLARRLRDADFVADRQLLGFCYRQALLEEAATIGSAGFTRISIKVNQLRGKSIYGVSHFGQLLVLRHVTLNIQRVTHVKQDDRRFIVECIVSLLREGVAFRLYKFDVKSFYENVNPAILTHMLNQDVAFSRQSARVVESFFKELEKLGINGLPRGLSISATLAEYLMQGFDAAASNAKGVLYYSRFVDDICVITDGRENEKEFSNLLQGYLPSDLIFNEKSKSFSFLNFAKDTTAVPEHTLDYLGYRIYVSKAFKNQNTPIKRDVWADISPSKVVKIKSRIAFAMLDYKKTGSFADLRDRVRVLTSNFSLQDRNTKADRLSGVRFNYPLVDSTRSTALPELDRFLRNALMSRHPRNRLRPVLTAAQRQELVVHSFSNGFNKKIFFHFSPKRLAVITKCWSYV